MRLPPSSRALLLVVLVALGVGGLALWKRLQEPALPAGFASGNGRIEATEVDVATKIAGRLAEVAAHEGDWVERGQVLARMDLQDLNAQLRQAEALVRQAREAARQARAGVAQRRSELALNQRTLARSQELVGRGFISKDKLDRDRTARETAGAALEGAIVQVAQAEAAVAAAEARVEQIRANLEDSALKTPLAGRVLYRLAEPGAVLAAGGKVLTVLDTTDVYMTLFLPTAQAGRVTVGGEARIVLDAYPQYVIPARVSFVAPEAQFTPREVETRTEREKLMFRVKVRIDPDLLLKYREKVKTGLPGVAYVRLDDSASWPARLDVKLPR